LGWRPQDWQDLWKPELKGRISLLNQPREVIGLVLKSLGASYNTADLDKVPELKPKLQALSQQVKFYSSTTYLQPLLLEDTWLAVGWSADLLPLIKEDPDIKVIIPQSGTSLWADLWVQPAGVKKENSVLSPIQQQWIEFCWQPKAVNQISLLSTGASPATSQIKSIDIIKEVRENPLLFPDPQIFEKSEFLYPLSPSTTAQYRQLWSLVNG
jgi:putative spermidine/putrescine transport system substrate-binding protein